MKVLNKSRAVIYVGNRIIRPGEAVELTKEEAKMSGVKAMLDSGELVIVRGSKA